MKRTIQIARWGNSLALGLPTAVATEAKIQDGEILVHSAQLAYSLRELLDKVTPENRHGETDWGPPQGHEQ